jgi:hypothetical protein
MITSGTFSMISIISRCWPTRFSAQAAEPYGEVGILPLLSLKMSPTMKAARGSTARCSLPLPLAREGWGEGVGAGKNRTSPNRPPFASVRYPFVSPSSETSALPSARL